MSQRRVPPDRWSVEEPFDYAMLREGACTYSDESGPPASPTTSPPVDPPAERSGDDGV